MCSNILELFESKEFVKVCAPMVRYSKLPFRALVRNYCCDLCFTPMILADSFVKSELARKSEFTTNSGDQPLVVQFAANTTYDFCSAAEMVAPYSNGVDLNCGCPQRWAMKDGYGACLLRKPELVRDLVLQVRNKIPHPYAVSVKIRILENARESIELCRMLEATGISFISVHARTPVQRHQPININTLRDIRDSIQLPLIANGDVKSLQDATDLKSKTGCDGVMVARGILANPALFAGYPATPLECVIQWVAISHKLGANFQTFHHHLSFMLEKIMKKKERIAFNSLKTFTSTLLFLEEYFSIDLSKASCTTTALEECKYNDIDNLVPKTQEPKLSEFYEEYIENTNLFDFIAEDAI